MSQRQKSGGTKPLSGPPGPEERSLDPADWGEFHDLCHEMLDAALGHLEGAGDGPVWRPVPDEVKAALAEPPPAEPQGAARVCEDFRRLVMPYATGNTHPRFFGWVHGSGTPGGMLAEMLAAALNANLGGRDHGPVYVERQVIDWCRRIFGLPDAASGLLVSGTSMATLIGLTVARNHKAGCDIRKVGLAGAPALVGYASAEAHGSIAKAFEILGLGRDSLRRVPVDANFEMDPAALARAVAEDRAAGLRPFCVVATAGTVNTGAIDDLAAIAGICDAEDLWLHVDGAFGAAAMFSENLKIHLQGIEKADSLAFDFHKWLHVPYDAGCVLVRDGSLHRAAFSSRQVYLAGAERGLAGGDPWFCEYGPELSRGFRALKVWFTLKEHGTRRLGLKVEDNCRQARYLAQRVEAHPKLELLAPVGLAIACFRFAVPGQAPEALDRINEAIVIRLQEDGTAAPSTTRIGGALAIRVNITNHRTRRRDLDLLVDAVVAAGEALTADASAPPPRAPDFRLADPPAIDAALTSQQRAVIEACCRRPELRPLGAGLTISLDVNLEAPFKVIRGGKVTLGRAAGNNAALAALHLRHAFELALLQRLTPGQWTGVRQAALGLLACRTAGFYYHGLTEQDRAACRPGLPIWLREAFDLLTVPHPGAIPKQMLGSLLDPLLRLQDGKAVAPRPIEIDNGVGAEFRRLLSLAAELAAPAEHLLTTGGDSRLKVDPATGLNAYGCSPRPRPWAITFASSTATSISEPAYRELERLRQGLISAALLGDLDSTYRAALEEIKGELRRFCGAGDLAGTEVVLSTSGTDAELYTLYLALCDPKQEVVNIVIAPDETGSGVVEAAWGRHFAPRTAYCGAVEAGRPLDGFAQDRVAVETVAARDADGALRPSAEIDGEVERLVDEARAGGRRCLLHILDSAKAGWGAPSLELVGRLRERDPEALDVVVDACQMRAAPAALAGYLRAGFMLQVTGSKFFTGPPFSGALIVPSAVARRVRGLAPLPASFADYAARAEWPGAWSRICGHLPERRNLGLLFRWSAALWEMFAFHAVPAAEQRHVLAAFAGAVQAAMAENPMIEPVSAAPFDRSPIAPLDSWDRLATIFPFLVRRPGADGAPLSYDEARKVYGWLNMDLSERLPATATAEQRRIAAKPCHIGQPVKLARGGGDPVGALRLCAGARIVSGVAFDPALGATPEERLGREVDDALLVLDKVALIVAHWDALAKAEAPPRRAAPSKRRAGRS